MAPQSRPMHKEIERQLNNNLVRDRSLMQLHSLIAHLEQTVDIVVRANPSMSGPQVTYLVRCFAQFAYYYLIAFSESINSDLKIVNDTNRYAYLQHQAIERLFGDSALLVPLLYASADPHIRTLEVLIRAARPVDIQAEQLLRQKNEAKVEDASWRAQFLTVPHFGRDFQLISFPFAPYVRVIRVPVYTLETPWDWHVVWHEMAGHVTRRLEEIGYIKDVLMPALEAEGVWEVWHQMYEQGTRSTVGQPTANASNVNESSIQTSDAAALAWSSIDRAGWVAEFIEDGYSIASLGTTSLVALDRILRQYYDNDYHLKDTRHPSVRLRLSMAVAMLRELGVEPEALSKLGWTSEQLAACERLRSSAKLLLDILVGNDEHPGYVRKKFTPKLASGVEAAKQLLISGKKTNDEIAIQTLVAAACYAFEEQPAAGMKIARAALQSVPLMDITAFDDFLPTAIPVPTGKFFKNLMKDKTWENLLEELHPQVDLVSPAGHDASGSHPANIYFMAHGQYHTLQHLSH